MPQITIDNRFFRHELNNYSNWPRAFWRELIQNSVDAPASKITIQTRTEGETCHIQFHDNGPGMSKETLENIYFKLGATNKNGLDTIGGHGRARILTCFAHERYVIRTQTFRVEGKGGEFQIEENQPRITGCQIEIETTAANEETLLNALDHYLKLCQISPEIQVNGKKFTQWLYRRMTTRVLEFASLHTTKQISNWLVARVKGVCMFTKYTGCSIGVILEIDPQKAAQILPVSRDHLKAEQEQVLEALLQELAIDHRSIERNCFINRTDIFGELKNLRKPKEKKEPQPQEPATNQGSTAKLAHGPEINWYRTTEGNNEAIQTTNGIPIPAGFQPGKFFVHQEGSQQLVWQGSLTQEEHQKLKEEEKAQARKERLPAYVIHFEDAPKKMETQAKRFTKEQIKGTRLKMLLAWEAAVVFFIEEILQFDPLLDVNFLPGLLFTEKSEGLCIQSQTPKGHLILIRPVNTNGKLAFSIHDYEYLYATALHECTHVIHHHHDEDFANMQTILTQRSLLKFEGFKKQIRNHVQTEFKKIESPEQ